MSTCLIASNTPSLTHSSWVDDIDFESEEISNLIDVVLLEIKEIDNLKSQLDPYQTTNELSYTKSEKISQNKLSLSLHQQTEPYEYFSKNATETRIMNEMTAIHAYYADGTSYGHVNINQNGGFDKYIWTFKLSLMDQSIIAIGIDSSQKQYTNAAFHETSAHKYYASEMMVMASYSFKYSLKGGQQKYSDSITDGDEVKMELSVPNKTLKFYINDIDQGIAFNNIDFDNNINYCMAVYAWKVPSITLTDFVCK